MERDEGRRGTKREREGGGGGGGGRAKKEINGQ